MTATLAPRTLPDGRETPNRFTLDAECGLVSHYKKGKVFDSIVEQSFAASWTRTKTEWRLEREVELVPLPGSVMVPDFRLVHPDGRSFVLEIVGYWRPEYLKKKFFQVARSGRSDNRERSSEDDPDNTPPEDESEVAVDEDEVPPARGPESEPP